MEILYAVLGNAMASEKTFQPHINGMRAVAILGVLLYHLNSTYCPAGYLGVDVFLVISGYLLLKGLVATDPARPGFRYGGYLARKAWKIFPSMLAVAVPVCAMAMWAMVKPLPLYTAKVALYSFLGVGDYYIDSMGGYFDTSSQFNPLLHFWYLGVTLQLYVLAPLLVVPLAKRCPRVILNAVLALLGSVSLAFYVSTTADQVPWNLHRALLDALGMETAYYHLMPRFWEIVAGYFILTLPAGGAKARAVLAWAGLLLCILPCFLLEKGSPCIYPAVLGAMLLLKYGDCGMVGRLLACRLLQWVGTISFSLYLWHWPVMVFWKYIVIYEPAWWMEAGMFTLSLLLAYAAWRIVERMRPEKWQHARLGAMVLRGICCLPLLAALGLGALELRAMHYREAAAENGPAAGADDILPFPGGGEPVFLLIGDSHANHLRAGLEEVCAREGIAGCYLSGSCTPYAGYYLPLYIKGDACWSPDREESLLAYLRAHPEIRYVLIAQHWERRLQRDKGYDAGTMSLIPEEDRLAFTSAALRKMCDEIRSAGAQVILLADTPMFPRPAPLDEYERCRRFGWEPPHREVTVERHRERNRVPDRLMQELLAEGRITAIIDLSTPLWEAGSCPARRQGEFLYKDTNHLTEAGSRMVAEYILSELEALDAAHRKAGTP